MVRRRSGTVALPHGLSLSTNPLAPSLVILGDTGSEKVIEAQGRNNLYWGEIACARECAFDVKHVPAGHYDVWVRLPGALPVQQRLASVAVKAGAATTLELAVPSALGEQSGARRPQKNQETM